MRNLLSFSSALGSISLLLFSSQVRSDLASQDASDIIYPTNSLINPGQLYPLDGPMPSPRLFSTMIIAGNSLIVYGGYRTDGTLLNDIHIYDIPTAKWSGEIHRKECCNIAGDTVETLGATSTIEVTPFLRVGFEGDIPLARAEHGACPIAGNMYLFGGISDRHGYLQDFHRFDPKNLRWTALDYTSGPSPERRAGHLMVSDSTSDSFAIIFGGRTNDKNKHSNSSVHGLNDVWKFEASRRSWTQLIPVSSGPSGRHHTAGTIMREVLYIYGGINPVTNVTYSDLWAFHIKSKRWQLLQSNSGVNSLPPLHSANLLPFSSVTSSSSVSSVSQSSQGENILLLYGGIGSGGSCGSGIELNSSSIHPSSFTPSSFTSNTATTSNICDQLFTELGQYYTININNDMFNSPLLFSSFNGQSDRIELRDLTGITWNISRISGSRSKFDGTVEGIHFVKDYGFETVAYDSQRNILYEFGGLKVDENPGVDDFDFNYSRAKSQQDRNIDGFEAYNSPRDSSISISAQTTITDKTNLEAAEILKESVWDFREAFFNIQPYISHSRVVFTPKFRSFVLTSEEMMLITDSDS